MDDMLKDKRFAHIAKDPKFRRIPKWERKVKIDNRFRGMLEDKKFTVKYTIDKRGRPINQTSTENLRKYYDLTSSDDEDEEEKLTTTEDRLPKEKKPKSGKKTIQKSARSMEEDEDSEKSLNEDEVALSLNSTTDFTVEDVELAENEQQLFVKDKNDKNDIAKDVKKKLRDLTIDYARGEGVILSDSSSDEETTENEDDEDEGIEHAWGELDKEAEETDEITHRLAACNMDWDRIRAVDLMVLFNSFLPPGGLIKSVTIYPSDFGLQRMKEEEIRGPIELVDADKHKDEAETDEENEEGSEYHMEKMRQYQLNRLKYYYAVLDCDSAETANKIYTECDGIEYESTSTKLDLRFIPEDMEFEHEPREVCDKLPDLSKYQPRQFTTTALQQVKVELTWDETNPERQEIAQKINSGKLEEVNEKDIQAYLASGTSDDESEVEEQPNNERGDDENGATTSKNPIDKYKLLLKSIEEQEEAKKKQEVQLEFTWGLGKKEKTEKLVKERLNKAEDLTPFEQYLEKRREKKKAKREERKKLREQREGDSADSNSDDSVPSDVDMNDPYFAEEMKNVKKSKEKSRNMKKSNQTSESNLSDVEDEERRKAELELLLLDKDDEGGKKHFNIKKIEEEATLSKSKRKRLGKKNKNNEKETTIRDDFEVDVADPRFTALYTSHHYNIDPADPRYRKTKGTEALITEKLKRRADPDLQEESPRKQAKSDGKMSADLAALVKSVKRNTKNISMPIK